jgi:fructan beta-fructosidase
MKRLLSLLFPACLVASALFAAPETPALYHEKWRPQFHFTPERNWMNDPNGLVYLDGEYHLFFQYNPEGDEWGHMSWGHAVSRDLTHWEQLPLALREENNVMIFTGCAVADLANTSGFGHKGEVPLVAVYTGHYTNKALQNQNLAYSLDRGRTWTKYAGNPVLDIGETDFRDPKVFWHEPSHRWVMAVAWSNQRKVRFYSSPNLKEWTHLSDFGPAGATEGVWECPNLFPVEVEGKPGQRKWVLTVNVNDGAPAGGSGCQYFVGDFDGTKFRADRAGRKAVAAPQWVDWARDFYAASTWDNIPASDGRQLGIGWLNNWQYTADVPTSPWRNAMTVPRAFSVRAVPTGWRLLQQPVRELETLRAAHATYSDRGGAGHHRMAALDPVCDGPCELDLDVAAGRDAVFALEVATAENERTVLLLDLADGTVTLDRSHSGNVDFHRKFSGTASGPLRAIAGRVKLHLFIDSSSIETFINDGETVLTALVLPSTPHHAFSLDVTSGEVWRVEAHAWKLRSIWR